jgi:hypothetical protein
MNRRELAQAMRKAIQRPEIVESREHYIDAQKENCLVCALGAALVIHYNGDYKKAQTDFYRELNGMEGWGYKRMAKILCIPLELANEISARHYSGQPIEDIASWLEASDEQEANHV